MSEPKRHHWWPKVQSKHWAAEDGKINVTKRDGTVFRTKPINIGVQSELYTATDGAGNKDTAVEIWLSETIDGPAETLIAYLTNPSNIKKERRPIDAKSRQVASATGFRLARDYLEVMPLPGEVRAAIAAYLAALVVRNPRYLEKLMEFHRGQGVPELHGKNVSLANMMYMFDVYREAIGKAIFQISFRDGSQEYLFGDCGLAVEEPWKDGLMPFNIHAPITPDIAISVLPLPLDDPRDIAFVSRTTNQGTSATNRIVVGASRDFIFSRQSPPIDYIKKNMGVPAPENVGQRIVNGQYETTYKGVTVSNPVSFGAPKRYLGSK